MQHVEAMNVLVVGPYPPCEDTNGLWVKAWGDALARAGGDVRLCVAASEEAREFTASSGDAPQSATTSMPLTVHRVWRRDEPSRTIVRKILAESDRFAPDVCHLHFNYFTYGNPVKSFAVLSRLLSAFSRRGVGTVVTLHSVVASPARYLATRWGLEGGFPRWVDRLSAFLGGLVLDRVLQDAQEVVVVSREALDWLHEHTRLRGPRASYIALGSLRDGLDLVAAGARDPRATPAAVPRVACVGRLVPYKGLESLIRAAGTLSQQKRSVQLTIMGSVEETAPSNRWYVQRLRRIAREEGDGAVLFEARYVPEPEYSRLQQEADVIVFPFRDDGIIGASGSALDFGALSPARLVLTDVPRLREYRGVPGVYYCPEGNPAEMAEAIWSATLAPPIDPTERGRKLMSFSPTSISAQYVQCYRRHSGVGPSGRSSSLPCPESGGAENLLVGWGHRTRAGGASADATPAPGAEVRARPTGPVTASGVDSPPR